MGVSRNRLLRKQLLSVFAGLCDFARDNYLQDRFRAKTPRPAKTPKPAKRRPNTVTASEVSLRYSTNFSLTDTSTRWPSTVSMSTTPEYAPGFKGLVGSTVILIR